MDKLSSFVQKYDFPIHFLIIINQHLIRRVSVGISSVLFKCRLKLLRCRYGENLKIDGFPIIALTRCGSISFGNNCRINSRFKSNLVGRTSPAVLECYGEGSITIGNNSGLSFTVISSRAAISIGEYVNIGGNVRIFDHDYHSLNPMDRRDGVKDRAGCRALPVCIGNDVFIGTNSIILKGVKIGDRAIVGAGSVVSCNIPVDEIWGGNPARKIKPLPKFD